MHEVTPTPKNLQAIAGLTIESFSDRRLELFDDRLRQDLLV